MTYRVSDTYESEAGTAALWTDGDPAECQVLKLWAQTVHRPQSV